MSAEQAEISQSRGHRKTALVITLLGTLLLAAVLPGLINVEHYRRAVAASIGRSLNRPVSIDTLQLRLLPTPGLEIGGFTVQEDPSFGAEPTLKANSVIASLRWSAMLRGRLEIGRISLDEASINLVERQDGKWNIGSLLLHPAAKGAAESAPLNRSGRFPYIEASDTRINFKTGYEKRPFSLLNADLSAWMDAPGLWRFRLKAQPVRTDLDLDMADTGVLRLDGSVKQADDVDAAPVDITAAWSHAALGQVSRLLAGHETGWRGDLTGTATITGDLRNLDWKLHLQVANAERQEFTPATPGEMDATCGGAYQRGSHSLENITCLWPAAPGQIVVKGRLQNLTHPLPDIDVVLDQVPAKFAVNLIGLVRQQIGAITATGSVSGDFRYAAAQPAPLTGSASTTDLVLRLPGEDAPLNVPTVRLSAVPPPAQATVRRRTQKPQAHPSVEPELILAPIALPLGAESPLNLSGELTRAGFALHLAGSASLPRWAAFASALGPRALTLTALRAQPAASTAVLDVQIQGPWMIPVATADQPESSTALTGTVAVRGVQLRPAYLAAPIEIASAAADLHPSDIAWHDVNLSFGHITAHGSFDQPLNCTDPAGCAARFSLAVDSLSAAALTRRLRGESGAGEILSAILARVESAPALPLLSGTIRANTLELGTLQVRNAVAQLQAAGSTVTLSNLTGDTLGGAVLASGKIGWPSRTPEYDLAISLQKAAASQVAALFHERWGTGIVNVTAHVTTAGISTVDLASAARGTFEWDWRNGAITVAAQPAFPLNHFDRWTASGTIGNQALTIQASSVTGRSAHYQRANIHVPAASDFSVTGKVSFDRSLDLTVSGAGQPDSVTGTLAHPVVATTTAQQ